MTVWTPLILLAAAPAFAGECEDALAKCDEVRNEAAKAMACVTGVSNRFPDCAAAHALVAELGNVFGYAAKETGNEAGMKPFFEKAFEGASKAAELQPRNPEYALARAHAAYESGKLDASFDSYTKALELAQDNASRGSAHAGRGCIYAHRGKFDEALREMEAAWRNAPDAQTLITRAEVFTLMGDNERARADYDQAISMIEDPPEYKAWVQKQRDKLPGGRGKPGGKGAGAAGPRPFRPPPGAAGSKPALTGKAAAQAACFSAVRDCYAVNKNSGPRDALKCNEKVLNVHGSCAAAHFQTGWLWGNLAEEERRAKGPKPAKEAWQKAKASYSQAVELEPNDALAMINRGMAEYKVGQYKAAIETLTKGLSLATKPAAQAAAHLDRGLAHAALGEHDKALPDYDAAYAYFKRPSLERARTYAALGRIEDARREYEAIATGQDAAAAALAKKGLDALDAE